ncbi:MAG: S1C family serine protease [Planctomycetaceae bacterium]
MNQVQDKRCLHSPPRRHGWLWAITTVLCLHAFPAFAYEADLEGLTRKSQAAAVKIYGAGGAGLEAYQSGFLVSPDGHIATAWSYVLDVQPVVVLDDGRRLDGTIVGFEPELELAIIKIEATDLPYLELSDTMPEIAEPVLAVSNLFGIATGDEPASVMQGMVAAVTSLDARRGTFKTPYSGPVLILDLVANNPGAAGGAVVDANGRAVGMLGKELRDAAAGVWLNYALPAMKLRPVIGDIVAGKSVADRSQKAAPLPANQSHSLAALGLGLIPDVLERTPAFVDRVIADSPAAKADVRPDDLILLLGNTRIESQRMLVESLRYLDRRDPVVLTVQRESRILSIKIQP